MHTNNGQSFLNTLQENIKSALLESAEPHIQKVLREIEIDMRKTIAKQAIAILEHHYEVSMDRDILTIKVDIGRK